jgi:hypothetical protein
MLSKNAVALDRLQEESLARDACLTEIMEIEKQYHDRMDDFQQKFEERYPHNNRVKHKRRPNAELERSVMCPFPGCGRPYGKETALNLHLKRKHNGGSKTDREDTTRGLLQFYSEGKRMPHDQLLKLKNIPPCLIGEIQEKHGILISDASLRALEQDITKLNSHHEELIQVEMMQQKPKGA